MSKTEMSQRYRAQKDDKNGFFLQKYFSSFLRISYMKSVSYSASPNQLLPCSLQDIICPTFKHGILCCEKKKKILETSHGVF